MPKPNLTSALALGVLVSALSACNEKPPEPKPEPKPTAAAPAGTDGPVGSPGAATTPASPHGGPHGMKGPHGGMGMPGAAAGGSEIGWVEPEAWEKVDHPSRMRKATFKIPKVDGDPEDAEMSVTQVGGGIEANIQRWEGQFDGSPKAKTEKKEIAGWEVTIVSIEGTFKSGGGPMMGGTAESKDDWALLAAIVNTEPAHFFKMTGPKKTVDAARGDFDSFVASFGKK